MSSENNAPPCKYYVGQVLGKVDVIVKGVEWEPDDEFWEINIDTDVSTSVESRYCDVDTLDDIVAEIDPVKKLDRLRLEAVALNEQINKLEEELGL